MRNCSQEAITAIRRNIRCASSSLLLLWLLLLAVGVALAQPQPAHRRFSSAQMPAFERLVRHHAPQQPLAGLHTAGEVHLFSSMGSLLRGLSRSGVPPQQIWAPGKLHSQFLPTVKELSRNKQLW